MPQKHHKNSIIDVFEHFIKENEKAKKKLTKIDKKMETRPKITLELDVDEVTTLLWELARITYYHDKLESGTQKLENDLILKLKQWKQNQLECKENVQKVLNYLKTPFV